LKVSFSANNFFFGKIGERQRTFLFSFFNSFFQSKSFPQSNAITGNGIALREVAVYETETLGASELTYEKFSENELRAKQLHETRVSTCCNFPQSKPDFEFFSDFILQSFSSLTFLSPTKQPKQDSFIKSDLGYH
jgi:hypothetical protein